MTESRRELDGQDELLLLRALLRASDYGVLLSDRSRRDLVCNRRLCALFGMDEAQIVRSPPEAVRALLLPRVKDPERFVRTLEDVYADPGLVREDEVELIAPRPRLLRRYTAPVHNEAGQVIGRLWTFLDITRTRRLENKVAAQADQLRVQSRQLAAALRETTGRLDKVENVLHLTQRQLFESEKLSVIGLLAASVAHDIRNILTPLTIELSLAEQDDAPADSFALMRDQVGRLDLLTRRLLALAKPAQAERAPLDIPALFSHLGALLTPHARTENVHLLVRCPRRRPPRVLADAAQIDQVLVNLTLNAIQAMRATRGGVLTLRASARRGGVALSVGDTGTGIPPVIRRRLFDPFFTTRPDGAGLGLFSCRRIAEAHGGTIAVRSAPGRGAQFTVWLPGE